ncbi:hypothetical protein LA080_011410 [Diaporthe eres]|nr:hypothetical protein LA080_011410 [Diaporthe eres]
MGTPDTFTSNCTLPPEGANFVSAPNIRGTLEIVCSCAGILLLCNIRGPPPESTSAVNAKDPKMKGRPITLDARVEKK